MLNERWQGVEYWLQTNVLTTASGAQGLTLILCLIVAIFLTRSLKPVFANQAAAIVNLQVRQAIAEALVPGIWMITLWLAILVFSRADWPHRILDIGISLLTAWVTILLASKLIRNATAARFIAWLAWTVAALNILGVLGSVTAALDGVAIDFSEGVRISLYGVIKFTMMLGALLWAAIHAGRLIEKRIHSNSVLSPSLQVLFSKSLNVLLVGLAVVLAVRSIGIDLTALTIFGGAFGLGLGFGLQKIVSNLVSGVILLVDKSIKPGDIITVDNTYGWVKALGGRYVSILTRDGTEHLIPNEKLFSERVVNWTHSSQNVRVKAPLTVHYDSDLRQAIEVCRQAASVVDRVLPDPAPTCLLRGFGDSGANLEIRFWISDAHNGVGSVRSAVLLSVWSALKKHGIEIPNPQRDVHIRSASIEQSSD